MTGSKSWRRGILACARNAVEATGATWNREGPFEVVVLLYLKKGKQFGKDDVDNRLKDILDGLQGAFNPKAMGKRRTTDSVIRNDSSVCRVVVEKQQRPKKYASNSNPPGGRLLIRPYTKCRWPLQVTKAAKGLRRARKGRPAAR